MSVGAPSTTYREYAPPDRVSLAAALLARHLADAEPPDDVARATVRWLAQHPHGRVHEFGRALHVSPRQLQRRLLSREHWVTLRALCG